MPQFEQISKNSILGQLQQDEVVDKLNNLKYAVSELETIHDDVATLIEDGDTAADKATLLQTEENWYNN